MAAGTTLAIGFAIARIGLKLWLRDSLVAQETSSELTTLLERKISNPFQQNKTRREFERVAEDVAQKLHPFFEAEYRGLPEHEASAAGNALAGTLASVPITEELLFAIDLQPPALEAYIRRNVRCPPSDAALSPGGEALYSFALTESCNYIVEMLLSLPAFQSNAAVEMLKRETQLSARVEEALSRLPSQAGDDPLQLFEREYKRAVARELDWLELYGVDADQAPQRFSLSVAYITLTAVNDSRDIAELDESALPDKDETASIRVDEALQTPRRILVRGDAGSGKTTMLQWLGVTSARSGFASNLFQWNSTVPFLLRLRRYARADLPAPEEFVKALAPTQAGAMPQGWVHTQLRTGRALLLIDGVDELPAARRDVTHSWLADLVDAFPDARYVITTRPAAVKDGWLDDIGFEHISLQPMTTGDIRAFVDHWYRASAGAGADERVVAAAMALRGEMQLLLREQPHLRSLATSPLLCAMLCALHKSRRGFVPRGRIQLYKNALDMLLERRDKERGIRADNVVTLELIEKGLLLQTLAHSLLVNRLTDVPKSDALAVVL
jgi:hypothetical protein